MAKWLAPLGLLLTWALTLWAYGHLPERIPAHWNAQGVADRYGSRAEVFLLPLVLTLLYLLLALAPRLDPKLRETPRVWPWLMGAVVWSLALLQATFLYAAWRQVQGEPFSVNQAVLLGVGLVFVLLGLLLPRLPANYFAGVRTPWTLESPRVWQATHRQAGWVFLLLGLLAWGVALAGGQGAGLWLWLGALLLGGLYLVLFSYLAWRRETG